MQLKLIGAAVNVTKLKFHAIGRSHYFLGLRIKFTKLVRLIKDAIYIFNINQIHF